MTTPTDGIALPPTAERPEPVTPRARRRGWSLRAHLIATVLVTVVLVVLSTVLVTAKDYKRARDEAVRNAKFQAGLAAGKTGTSKTPGAESISGSIPDLRALIVRSGTSLGQATGGNLAALPADKCNLSFQSFRSFSSGTLNIVMPDGTLLCSSNPALVQPGSKPYAGATWLTPVTQKSSATVVGPLVDPVTKKYSLFVAAPIPAPNAPPESPPPGVLAVSIDLTPLADTLHDRFVGLQYPGNSLEYLITTKNQDRIVSRSIKPEQAAGKSLPPGKYAKADGPRGAWLADIDGTERLYASQSVDELGWHVYAGISKTAVNKPAKDAFKDHLTVGLIIVLGVGLVALAGIFTVARR